MISKDHKHHQKQDDQFHQNEIGVWGIGCTSLAQLYEYIKTSNPSNKIGYYDVKHEFESTGNNFTLCFNNIELSLNTDCRGHQINHFYTEADMLLINGNHHTASKMILILDGKKEFKTNESHLEKTIAIFYNEQTKTLAEEIKHNYNQCELINGTDLSIIDSYFNFFLKKIQPALHGLILTGGESSRMKENKSLLVYHQQAQWLHLYDLLDEKCEKTFVSCPENKVTIYNGKPIITDTIIGYGPLSGILSGLLQLKNKALLVLACDLPLITKQTINQLVESRDPSKMATAFLNPESNFLEPLITIYEPKALAIMLTMLSQGYTCPRKMLIQNDIKVIHPENPSTLKNINFPEEKEQALEMIKKYKIMTVNILFFGALVEVTKVSSLALKDITNSEEALVFLHKQFPLLCHYKFSLALNQTFLTDTATLHDGDELALLPPFAGG